MSDIKYIYFDLRVKGEPARLLLAHNAMGSTANVAVEGGLYLPVHGHLQVSME